MGCFYSANKTVIDVKWEDKDCDDDIKLGKLDQDISLINNDPLVTNNNIKVDKKNSCKPMIIDHYEEIVKTKMIEQKLLHSGYVSGIDEISFKKTTCNTRTAGRNKRSKQIHIFANKLLNEINLIRNDPQVYANKVEHMMQFIQPNNELIFNPSAIPFMFEYGDMKRIGLRTGEEGFVKCIEYLKSVKSLLPELKWNEEIRIDLSECDDFTSDSFQLIIEQKKEIIGNKHPLFSVNIDVVPDPEISALLQLIDDTPFQGKRRDAILNPEFTYLAISQGKDKKKRLFTFISFA